MEPLVRAASLHGLAETIQALGADPDRIFAEAGLSRKIAAVPGAWISFRSVLGAYEIAASGTACPSFGLRLTDERDLSYLGPLVLIFKYSDSLESGLRSSIKYLAVQNTGFDVALRDADDELSCWSFTLAGNLRAGASQWIEESIHTALSLLRIFLGDQYLPAAVHFRHRAISDPDVYRQYFGENVSFGADQDGILIDRRDLDAPNAAGDDEMFRFLTGYLDARVTRASNGIAANVHSLLRQLIPTGKFSIDVVADQLGMHRRTLQRRLEKAGSSYVELLDKCRSQMAIDYLQTSNLPMVNLALSLGYADQSAFNHAFKRWHGTSPQQWRDRIVVPE